VALRPARPAGGHLDGRRPLLRPGARRPVAGAVLRGHGRRPGARAPGGAAEHGHRRPAVVQRPCAGPLAPKARHHGRGVRPGRRPSRRHARRARRRAGRARPGGRRPAGAALEHRLRAGDGL
ncbi:MAG: hypothetical protein AVDCRST_MAG16-1630, partial [uncultured Frankineae bacterium]